MLKSMKEKLENGDYDQKMDEMGESEMEEGYEEDMELGEEGEEEYVEDDVSSLVDSDGEEIPQTIPADVEGINHEKRDEVSDIDVNEYSSSSEYNSDDLDPDSLVNPHGFVFSGMLDTYQKSKKERISDLAAMKEEDYANHRARFLRKNNKRGQIGKSERKHQKNKPFMMVKKKKMMANGKMVKKMMAGGKTKKGYAMGKTVGAAKPDFLDIDKDGNKTEYMKEASQDKKQTQGNAKGGAIKKMAGGKMVKKMMAKGKMVKGGAKGGKKKAKAKVRGAGIARKGVRPAKMR